MDNEALVYLDEHGFVPGSEATVAARGPDGSLALAVAGGTVELGPGLARLLYYVPAAPAAAEGWVTAPEVVASAAAPAL